MHIGSDPRVCTFCTHIFPNADALLRHYEYAHGEWVKDLFDTRLPGSLSEPSWSFLYADLLC